MSNLRAAFLSLVCVVTACAVDATPSAELASDADEVVDVPDALEPADVPDVDVDADLDEALAPLAQTCPQATLRHLQSEVTRLCKSPGTRLTCKPSGNCTAWWNAAKANQACRKARVAVQKQCYGGIWDTGHRKAVQDLDRAVAKCDDLWRRNHCTLGI